jgi:dienelactone hydrolase
VRTYAKYVISRRRALDLLPELAGADGTRVAAVGFSFGSAVTGTLVGVDHRLKAAVIQSGPAHHAAAVRDFCARLGRHRLAAYLEELSVVDPVNYVGRAAPTSLLFQNGTQDGCSPRTDVNAYVKAASAPKEQRWYRAGHGLNARAFAYRDAWLARHLLG